MAGRRGSFVSFVLIYYYGILSSFAASPSGSRQTNPTARSFNDPGISSGYRSSVANNPFANFPSSRTDQMDFNLPGAPRPPEPPILGGGGQYTPFMSQGFDSMNPRSGYGGFGGNDYGQGGYANNGMTGYGGNGGSTNYAQGGQSNGYQPQGSSYGSGTGNNKQNTNNQQNAANIAKKESTNQGADSGALTAARPKDCNPESLPDVQGFCVLRNQIKRKCKELQSGFSTDCSGKEMCCYNPDNVITTRAPPTEAAATPPISRLSASDQTAEASDQDRFCIPDADTNIPDGICIASSDVEKRCSTSRTSTSTNCNPGETCCYTDSQLEPKQAVLPMQSYATSNPVTSTINPNTRLCSPGSYPTIANGLCTASSQIAQSCKGKQISPSVDCRNNEYCCFVADSPNGGLNLPAGSCSPASNPLIANGVCVNSNNIAKQCPGMLVSPSLNCQGTDLCCFIVPTTVATTPTTRTTRPTTTSTTTVTTATPVTTPQTTRTTGSGSGSTGSGSTGNGQTPSSGASTADSGSVTVTPLPVTTSSSVQTVSTGPALTNCRPGKPPSGYPNGTCVHRSQIAAQCKGIQIDYSLDCGVSQYCCYTQGNGAVPVGTIPATIAPGSCTPDSNRAVNNGFCVNDNQLTARCAGIEASTSPNCATGQYCCYSSTGVPNLTVGTTGAYYVTTAPTVSTGSATPTGSSAPSTPTGTPATNTPTGTPVTNTPTGTPVTNMPTGTPATNTQSSTSSSVTMQSATGYSTPSSTGTVTPVSDTTTSSTTGKDCSPQNYHNLPVTGKCRSIWNLNPQCAGMQAAPSLNCSNGEYCCFSNPVAPPLTYVSGGGSPCTPELMPTINNGVCIETAQLAEECAAHEVGTSLQCNSGQLCCYLISGEANTIPSVTPSTPSNGGSQSSTTVSGGSPSTSGGSPSSTPASGGSSSTPSGGVVTSTGAINTQGPTTYTLPQAVSTTTQSSTVGGACSPQAYPNVVNGKCLSVFNLASGCAGKQAAPSLNCGQYEYCCFTNPVEPPNQTQPPAGACSPDINPTVDGVCVDNSQISVQCDGNDISMSGDCLVTQMCCFNPGGGPFTTSATPSTNPVTASTSAATVPSTPSTGSTTQSTSTSTAASGNGSGKVCSPESSPGIQGTCWSSSVISQRCADQQMASSNDCPYNEFCCFSSAVTTTTGTTTSTRTTTTTTAVPTTTTLTTPPTATTTTRTTTTPTTTTSTTTPTTTTSTTTTTPTTSTTPTTTTRTTTTTTVTTPSTAPYSSGSACKPQGYTGATVGKCVNNALTSQQCSNNQLALSLDCGYNEYCCFPAGSATTTSQPYIYSNMTNNKALLTGLESVSGCSPQTAPWVTNGRCVDLKRLTSECRGQRIAKSMNCASKEQYCCFADGKPDEGTNVPPQRESLIPTSERGCIPNTEPSVSNGVCIHTTLLATRCRAQRISKSDSCQRSEFCCFVTPPNSIPDQNKVSVPVKGNSGVQLCSPSTAPSVTNGICTPVKQLQTQCIGMVFAKSSSCGGSEFCCFDRPNEQSVREKSCTPSTQPSIRNGGCVALDQLTSRCRGMTFSKSGDCTAQQFCCFSPAFMQEEQNRLTVTSEPCSPRSAPEVINGRCVASHLLTSQCRGMRLSKSDNCPQNQFCCFDAENKQTVDQNRLTTTSVLCSPLSAPEVTNGRCVATNLLTSHCREKRLSKSTNCPPNHFCCFATEPEPKPLLTQGISVTACTPNTQPEIHDGFCADMNQLTSRCRSMTFAKSSSCASSQFCCFSSNQAVTSSQGGIAQGGITQGAAANKDDGQCTPQSQPGLVSAGRCVDQTLIINQCRGQRLSKSADCQSGQFCCFSPDAMPQTVIPTKQVTENSLTRTCTPSTEPSIHDGKCTERNVLITSCVGQRFAKSSDCPASQFCCFSLPAPDEKVAAPSGKCSPASEPTVKDGACLSLNQLTTSCQGGRLSKSADCGLNQFCCFQASAAQVTQPQEVNKIKPETGNRCRPASNPDVTEGMCLNANQLTSNCSAGALSKSVDCEQGQFCCFNRQNDLESVDRVRGPCIPDTDPTGSGECVKRVQLVERCQRLRVSKSKQCGASQFCCFSSDTIIKQSQSGSCSPMTDPAVTNGFCLNRDQLSTACAGNRFAKSNQCRGDQFCCFAGFDNLTISPTSLNEVNARCSPNSDPSVKNGNCVAKTQLSSQCADKRFSKSNECGTNEFCCFDLSTPDVRKEPSSAVLSAGSCSPVSDPSITGGLCVDRHQLSQQCGNRRFSKSTNCNSDQFCCFDLPEDAKVQVNEPVSRCTPNSDTSINNGVCLARTQLMTQCQGKLASKSVNCSSDQFCCFSRDANPSKKAVLAGLMSCSPTCDPTVTNGVCLTLPEVAQQCQNKVTARSTDCAHDQFCCYAPPNDTAIDTKEASTAPTSCSPSTDPTITTGTCLNLKDIAKKCANMLTTSSKECADGQFCCFAPHSGAKLEQTFNKATIKAKSCAPTSDPTITNGVCLNLKEISQQCVNKLASNSTDCASDEFCCFGQTTDTNAPSGSTAPPTLPTSTSPPGTNPTPQPTNPNTPSGSKSCSPSTDPTITNGTCLNLKDISQKCLNMLSTSSNDCTPGQFCCFAPPVTAKNAQNMHKVAVANGCSPMSDPEVKNGVCLDVKDLSQQCKNHMASKSGDCGNGQFCCFTRETDKNMVGSSQILSQHGCSPVTDPSITDGICLDFNQLVSKCQDRVFSKSEHCDRSQFCCFKRLDTIDDKLAMPLNAPCAPNSDPLSAGTCVERNQLTEKCAGQKLSKSTNCSAGQFCCFGNPPAKIVLSKSNCAPLTDPSVTDGTCVDGFQLTAQCADKRFSKSSDCQAGEFCCFAKKDDISVNDRNKDAKKCTPLNEPSNKNGWCTDQDQLSDLCKGSRVSTSSECSPDQFCCFNQGQPFQIPAAAACSPETEPGVTNGKCVSKDQLPSQCNGMTFARSFNCQIGDVCCFGSQHSLEPMKQSVTNTGGCTPITAPDIHNGKCTSKNQLEPQCLGQRFSKSNDCTAADQFCCFAPPTVQCTPSTAPTVNNGACVHKDDLPNQCKNMALSKSSNCSTDQFCCFDRVNAKQKVVPGSSCLPNSDSSAVDGVCLNRDQIPSCAQGRLSKSENCEDDQFCCFDNAVSNKETGPAACSPITSPGVINGACVAKNQLSLQCKTKRFAKSTGCSGDQFCCFDRANATEKVVSGSSCLPNSDHSAVDGICLNREQLTSCAQKRLSKSENCEADQFCCFDNRLTDKQTASAGCSPITAPGVTNGECVSKNQLSMQCKTKRFAKSTGCSSDQFCCFDTPDASSTPAEQCTPNSRPSITSGSCVQKADLSAKCSDKAFSKSVNCSTEQFCCFDAAQIVNKESTAVCTPNTAQEVQNGMCVDKSQLHSECSDLRISKSAQCTGNQMCCFESDRLSTDVVIAPKSRVCRPSTDPTSSGKCVTRNDLMDKCTTMTFSKSGDCLLNEFCCFDKNIKQLALKTCSPQSDLTVNDGWCVASPDLQTDCENARFSRSSNCVQDQWCCFKGHLESAKIESPDSCSPIVEPSLNNGTCVDKEHLRARCSDRSFSRSTNCKVGQMCCFDRPGVNTLASISDANKAAVNTACSPQSDPAATNGVCLTLRDVAQQCANKLTSESNDCAPDQFCCFTPSNDKNIPPPVPKSCSPATDPMTINGTCMNMKELSQKCANMLLATSNDCSADQFCCYGQSSATKTAQKVGMQSGCTPLSAPEVHNGVCLNADQLSAQCNGQRFAKSSDCDRSQFCCFPNPEAVVTTSCTPVTEPSVTNGTCVSSAALTTKCANQLFAKSSSCGNQQFCCFSNPANRIQVPTLIAGSCSPSTEPQVTNGICTEIRDLKEKCQDKRLSKSINCADQQFCCFTGENSNTASKVQSVKACIPNSNPSKKDGVCLNLNQITTQCQSKRLSKSTNCDSQQFCCFSAETKEAVGQRSPCIPNSDLAINNGQCLPIELLQSQCNGQSFAKSANCPKEEFCCFDRSITQNKQGAPPPPPDSRPTEPPPTADSTKTPTENTIVTLTGSPPIIPPAGACTPNKHPDVTNGQCMPKGNLPTSCAGRLFGRSRQCSDDNYCCFGTPSSVQSIQPAKQCIPETNPDIVDGVCLDESQLASQCKGRSVARSFNCESTQKCCFDRNSDKTMENKVTGPLGTNTGLQVSPAGSDIRCSPNSQPEITNGACMKIRDLRVSCLEKRASPSEDCPRFSWCCFDAASATAEIPLVTTTTADLPSVTTTTAQPVLTPNPNREQQTLTQQLCIPMSNPFSDGVCLNLNQVQSQCEGRRLSKSVNCAKEQFCCFQTEPAKEQLLQVEQRGICIPSSDLSVIGGRCTNTKDLETRCANQALSKSVNCENDQFCCFTRPELVNKISSGQCSPITDPSVTNGTCLEHNQLVQQCSSKRFAKSQNCAVSQYCCFDGQVSTGSQCVPETDASVTNGQCMSSNLLKDQCASRTFARSANCGNNEKCCFDRSVVSNKVELSVGTCSPSTDPTVKNGICLNLDQLTPQCGSSAQRFSKSENCGRDQFCCFGNDEKAAERGCSPKSEPEVRNGSCLNVDQLVGQCRGKAFSKSQDCDGNQFCCFDVPNKLSAGIQCIPQSDPSVMNGICVSDSQLANQCGSKFFSRSANCRNKEMCCFDRVADKQSVTGCSPVTNPSVTNGVCLNKNQLTPQCSSKRFSKSENCASDQFCCFESTTGTTQPGSQCMPETDPTVTNGQCVATSQLSAQCASKTFSRSANCGSSERCCFERTNNKVNTGCSPDTNTDVINGVCVDKEQLASQCGSKRFAKSRGCGDRQYCCFDVDGTPAAAQCSPETDVSITNGVCLDKSQLSSQCNGKAFARSFNCGSSQVCCFERTNQPNSPKKNSGSCSPANNPAITSGRCLNVQQIAEQCKGKLTDKSSDCTSDQFCCFDQSSIKDGGTRLAAAPCSPETDPSVTNGMCLDKSQLTSQCSGKSFARSRSCGSAQVCCFDRTNQPNSPKATAGSCRPANNPAITNGKCLNVQQIAQQCKGKLTDESSDCTSDQFCCFDQSSIKDGGTRLAAAQCSPETDPSITNGMCLDKSQLTSQCSGKSFARSPSCGSSQVCCFDRNNQPNSPKETSGSCRPANNPATTSGKCLSVQQIGEQCKDKLTDRSSDCAIDQFCCFDDFRKFDKVAMTKSCSPATDPAVKTGACLNIDQLSTECGTSDKKFSKSADCSNDQFCCFGHENTLNKAAASTCSPASEPAVTNGTCLNAKELSTQCNAKRFSKSKDCDTSQFCCFGAMSQPPSGGQCSPQTDPSISNGMCVDKGQLSSQCGSKFFSQSSNCNGGQMCCFDRNSQPPRIKLAAGSCSPSTDPAVTNGVCLNADQLTSQCATNNKRFSKSNNCNSDQFCCFGSQDTFDKAAGSGCSPITEPSITNGTCLEQSQLVPLCSTKRFAKSQNCAGNQFCCFDFGTSSSSHCVPETDSSITNGQCVLLDQLKVQCGSKTFARSSNCGSNEKCCFDRSSSSKIQVSAGTCSPSTNPSVQNGICLNLDQLTTQCGTSDKTFSKSDNCNTDQFCCFASEDGFDKASGSNCSPNTEPSITNGTCINANQLSVQCNTRRFSKSKDCDNSQFCCFDAVSQSTSGAGGQCSPQTDPSITNGQCMNKDQLTNQCGSRFFSQSSNCASGQLCCFDRDTTKIQLSAGTCSPSTNPSVKNGVCLNTDQLTTQCGTSDKKFSKSDNCNSDQFCCFASDDGFDKVSGSNCSPNTEPSITNGTCINANQLSVQCNTRRFSKSKDCDNSQFCCFDAVSQSSSGGGQCSPQTDPMITNGQCVSKDHLTSQCGSRFFSQSSNCGSGQMCCFDRDTTKTAVGGCTPMTDPSVTNGTCLDKDQLSAQCANKRFARSTGCSDDQFCCFNFGQSLAEDSQCVPDTDSSINDGVCVTTDQLTEKCGTKSFARSFNCAQNEKCCFDRNAVSGSTGLKVSVVNGSNLNMQVSHCTPNSEPTVNNGVCLNIRELAAHCVDKSASPSPDCPRLSWCCFENPNANGNSNSDNTNPNRVEATKTCTPNSDPSVHNGMCVQRNQLNTVCRGGRSSKSSDCGSADFCCFNVTAVSPVVKLPPPPSCSPNSDPSVHDGQCMKMRELSVNCIDRRAAPSLDCAFGQWCCFGEPMNDNPSPTTPDTPVVIVEPTSENSEACAPTKNKALRNGQCMSLRELNANCTDRQAGPSEDCEFGSWCCYSDPAKKFVVENMQAAPVVETPQVVVPVQPGQPCAPNADPNATDGTCLPTKDLRVKCRNRRVSKSPQCKLGHWCCFSTAEPHDFVNSVSPVGRSLSGIGVL